MKQLSRPTSIEFFQLYDLVDKETRVLEKLKRHGAEPQSSVQQSPLLGLFFAMGSATKEGMRTPSLVAEVARVEAAISDNQALKWLRSQPSFMKIKASLERKAKKYPASKFAEPVAVYKLIQCTLFGLGVYASYVENRRKPGQMTKKDWDEAIRAVQTLRSLQRHKGLNLTGVFAARPGAPSWDGALQFEERLVQAKQASKKPHDDGFVSDRAAARKFTEWLLMMFDEAPPTMVESFAEFIGYNKDSARKQLKSWEQAHRTDSLV